MNVIFIVILLIIVVDFLFQQFLEYLNSTKRGAEPPSEIKDVFNEVEYKKQQEYDKINGKFEFVNASYSLLIILLMLFLGGFSFVDGISKNISNNVVLLTLIFFGILMFAQELLEMPFSLYNTFVIEEKFGFNRTTIKTYILDKIKGLLLGGIIGGVLLSAFVWFYYFAGNLFWVYAWVLVSVFMVLITTFYSSVIVPLFNKQTKLEDGELKEEIEKFSRKVGFKLDNIYKIDGSKRSTKANAYFSGLGKKKRIVLYDTLINDLSVNEIVAVLAHEIGHYKNKHTLYGLILSILQTGFTLFVLSLFVSNPLLAGALGVNSQPNFHIGLIVFGILYSPISTFVGLAMNIFSRKNEYQADEFAKNNYSGEYLISGLKKLSGKNLSNLTPHWLYVYFYYSHPTLLQRIKNINKTV